MRNQLMGRAFLVVLLVFILNKLAMQFYWYVSIPWLDMPMHFLGGIFLALGIGALFFHRTNKIHFFKKLLFILLWVLLFGIAWELFEFSVFTLIKFVEPNSMADTLMDLFFDLLGGLVGIFFVSRAQNKYNSPNGNR